MIIAHFTIDHPLLRRTLSEAPGAALRWEDSYTGSDGRMRLTGWVTSDDDDAVDRAVAADPSVENPAVLAESRGRRLFRFDFDEDVERLSTRAVIAEVGGVNRTITADADGWQLRTEFPDRRALEHVYDFCRRNDVPFALDRIYELSELSGGVDVGLSPAQHETLVAAAESGYLDVPRRTSLAELGELLGVSESATSERFRRGVRRLVDRTLRD